MKSRWGAGALFPYEKSGLASEPPYLGYVKMTSEDLNLPLILGDQSYRTCQEFDSDCIPGPFIAGKSEGIRAAFICPNCGVHSVIDPFEHLR